MLSDREVRKVLAMFMRVDDHLVINKTLCRFTGDISEAVFLSHAMYWSEQARDNGGWFHKTYAEWYEAILLSKYRISQIAKDYGQKGYMETMVRAVDGTPVVHYRVDCDKVLADLVEYMDSLYNNQSENFNNGSNEIAGDQIPLPLDNDGIRGDDQNENFNYAKGRKEEERKKVTKKERRRKEGKELLSSSLSLEEEQLLTTEASLTTDLSTDQDTKITTISTNKDNIIQPRAHEKKRGPLTEVTDPVAYWRVNFGKQRPAVEEQIDFMIAQYGSRIVRESMRLAILKSTRGKSATLGFVEWFCKHIREEEEQDERRRLAITNPSAIAPEPIAYKLSPWEEKVLASNKSKSTRSEGEDQ